MRKVVQWLKRQGKRQKGEIQRTGQETCRFNKNNFQQKQFILLFINDSVISTSVILISDIIIYNGNAYNMK